MNFSLESGPLLTSSGQPQKEEEGAGEEQYYNQSSYLFLPINIFKIKSLTGYQRIQHSNYMPEKHQQLPLWQKKNKNIHIRTYRWGGSHKDAVRRVVLLYLKKCGRRDSKLALGSSGTN